MCAVFCINYYASKLKSKRQSLYFFGLVHCLEYIIAFHRCFLIISQSKFLLKVKLGVEMSGLGECVKNHCKYYSLSFICSDEGRLGPPFLLNYTIVYFLVFNRLAFRRKG